MNLVPFFENFDDRPITMLKEDTGAVWFLAKDLAAPLNVTRDAVRMQIAELDTSDKRVSPIYTSTGTKNATFVSESGALQIIVQSRKPESRRLRKWVCDLAVRYAKGEVVEAVGNYVTREEFGAVVNLLQGLTQAVQALAGGRRGMRHQSELPVWTMGEHHRMRRLGYTRATDFLTKETGSRPAYGKPGGLAIRSANYSSQHKIPVHRFLKGSTVMVYLHEDTLRQVHRTGWSAKTAEISEAQMGLFDGNGQ